MARGARRGGLAIRSLPAECTISIPTLGIANSSKSNKLWLGRKLSAGAHHCNFRGLGSAIEYEVEIPEDGLAILFVNFAEKKVVNIGESRRGELISLAKSEIKKGKWARARHFVELASNISPKDRETAGLWEQLPKEWRYELSGFWRFTITTRRLVVSGSGSYSDPTSKRWIPIPHSEKVESLEGRLEYDVLADRLSSNNRELDLEDILSVKHAGKRCYGTINRIRNKEVFQTVISGTKREDQLEFFAGLWESLNSPISGLSTKISAIDSNEPGRLGYELNSNSQLGKAKLWEVNCYFTYWRPYDLESSKRERKKTTVYFFQPPQGPALEPGSYNGCFSWSYRSRRRVMEAESREFFFTIEPGKEKRLVCLIRCDEKSPYADAYVKD